MATRLSPALLSSLQTRLKTLISQTPYNPPSNSSFSFKVHLITSLSTKNSLHNLLLCLSFILSSESDDSPSVFWITKGLFLAAKDMLEEIVKEGYNCNLIELVIEMINEVVPTLKRVIKESCADVEEADDVEVGKEKAEVGMGIVAAYQLRWLVSQVGHPELGKLCWLIIPCALTALDHWSPEIKEQGMHSFIHIGKNVSTAELSWYEEPILDACCKNIALSDELWERAVEMSVLLLTRTQQANPRSSWYEKMVSEMLSHLERQPYNTDRRTAWLLHIEPVFDALGLVLLAHFRRIFSLFFQWMHADDDKTVLLVMDRLETIIKLTWIRNSPYIDKLIDELILLYKETSTRKSREVIRSRIVHILVFIHKCKGLQFEIAWEKHKSNLDLMMLVASFNRVIGRMTNNGCDLPEHVLFDILSWLSVASLLRFKSVCKVWYALIGSSTFIAEHLHRSNHREETLIAYGKERGEGFTKNSYYYMLINGREYQKFSKLDHMQVLLATNWINGDYVNYRLVGCCDGLVCLRTSYVEDFALCNPATKQVKYLPKPSFPTPPTNEVSRFDGWVVMGFGFDFKSNDYKVVRVLIYADEPGSGNHNIKIVEVYSKRANCWRTLHKKGVSLPFKHIDKYPQATNVDGTCFWIGRGFDYTNKLVFFDLRDEVFGLMSLPGGDSPIGPGLDILNDKLVYMKGVGCDCVYEPGEIRYCPCRFESGYKFFEVWMLHELGIDESWSRLYKIGPIYVERPVHNLFYYPIRLSKNGEFVVLIHSLGPASQSGELRLYNLRIQGNHLPLILQEGHSAYELFHYSESLVSVGG